MRAKFILAPICKQNNQFPTKSRDELEDNSSVTNSLCLAYH